MTQYIWTYGFRHFIAALSIERGRSDHYSLLVMIERWMDTTHTFYTHMGEFTISLMSFSAITRIAFRGTSVPFNINYCNIFKGARGQYVHDLFGFMPT